MRELRWEMGWLRICSGLRRDEDYSGGKNRRMVR
jgi:hypothetical protein